MHLVSQALGLSAAKGLRKQKDTLSLDDGQVERQTR